jgi:hypothetical protein
LQGIRAISNSFGDCRQTRPGQEIPANRYPRKGTGAAFKATMRVSFILRIKPFTEPIQTNQGEAD